MRKFILLVFIISFIGSASAAAETYHFTAEISGFSDGTGIFSDLGYTANMPLKGTIIIDPEIEATKTNLTPSESGAFGWWPTGVIKFENQNYEWSTGFSPSLLIINYVSDRQTDISTKQGSLDINPDVTMVVQQITLKHDGLDASMPSDLSLSGNTFVEYFVQIQIGQVSSWFKANITNLAKAEEAADNVNIETVEELPVEDNLSTEQSIDSACPCDDGWKNHGQYVSCVANATKELVAVDRISNKERKDIIKEAAKSDCGKKDKKK
jgi:hypothetical protein